MIKKKIIIFLFFITSCGYQPIFVGKNTNGLIFNDIELVGEKNINRKLISISGFKKDQQNYKYSKLKIDSKKNIIETSKNSKGQAETFKMTIEMKLVIENKGEEINSKSFVESFSYNNIENKFDLASYENDIENILINKIFEKLIIYFSL